MATEAENTAVTQVSESSEHASASEGGVTAPEAAARTGKFHSSQLAVLAVSPRSLGLAICPKMVLIFSVFIRILKECEEEYDLLSISPSPHPPISQRMEGHLAI